MGYTHLTEPERYQIFILLKSGLEVATIAAILKRHRSSIYRELSRNREVNSSRLSYSPSRAHDRARYRRTVKPRFRIVEAIWRQVWDHLCCRWSPEQIAGRLKVLDEGAISHETIYRRIWRDQRAGGGMWQYLRLKLRRGRRYRTHSPRGQITGRIGIEQRPQIVADRRRRGDGEVDTLFGQRSRRPLVTLVERTSRYLKVEPVVAKQAEQVKTAVIRALKPLPGKVHTITSDNGREFAEHRSLADALKARFYFARPYASWERGTNENMNGLLRQYFPKHLDFSTITQQEIDHAVTELNARPRKCLAFKTPQEVFFAHRTVALRS